MSLNVRRRSTPPTPPPGYVAVYVDDADGHLKQLDENGLIVDLVTPPIARYEGEVAFLAQGAGTGVTETITVTRATAPHNLVVMALTVRQPTHLPPTITDTKGNTWQIDGFDSERGEMIIASTGQDFGAFEPGDDITPEWGSAPSETRIAYVEEFSGISTLPERVVAANVSLLATSGGLIDSGQVDPGVSRGVVFTAHRHQAEGWPISINAVGTIGTYLGFPAGVSIDPHGTWDRVMSASYRILSEVGSQRHFASFGTDDTAGIGAIVVYKAAV